MKKKSLFCFATLIIFYIFTSFNSLYKEETFKGKLTVVEVKENYYILKGNDCKFVCYDDYDFNLYEQIYVEGESAILDYNLSTTVSSFNDYLHKQNVNNSIKINNYEEIFKGDVVRPKIIDYLLDDLSIESQEIVSLLFLGNKKADEEMYGTLSDLSLIQLFVISGFHLNILATFLNKIFKKRNIISVLLLIPYCYLLNFSIPIIRSWLFLLAKTVHKKKNINVSNIKILTSICLLMLCLNYTNLLNISFQLTFITNLIIMLLENLNIRNKLFDIFVKPLLIYISIIPILLSFNYEISIVGFFYAYFLSLPVTILFLLSAVTAILKLLDPLLKIIYLLFKQIINFLSFANIQLLFGKMKPYFIIIFYLLLFLLIYSLLIKKRKNTIISSFAIMLIFTFQYFFNDLFLQDQVVFLDVGQGDSTLVLGHNNSYVILIDTGGSKYSDIATKKIIPYLKSRGIKKLDAVIITHNDFDHNGALESLSNNFQVNEIINGYEEENIIINNFKLQNLNQYHTFNSSDNETSAVLYFQNKYNSYLIMGDAPKNIESKILKDYVLEVDYLRIGHHGSKSSSSEELIKNLKPQYAIISVGKNIYGHPNKEVIDLLEKYDIPLYRTDINHNILSCKDKIFVKH